jgi:photosystem I reaction center subunit XII
MITDSQIYTAMLIALVASVLAIRLGSTLYQ